MLDEDFMIANSVVCWNMLLPLKSAYSIDDDFPIETVLSDFKKAKIYYPITIKISGIGSKDLPKKSSLYQVFLSISEIIQENNRKAYKVAEEDDLGSLTFSHVERSYYDDKLILKVRYNI